MSVFDKDKLADLVENLAVAIDEDRQPGEDPQLPFDLVKEADKIKSAGVEPQ